MSLLISSTITACQARSTVFQGKRKFHIPRVFPPPDNGGVPVNRTYLKFPGRNQRRKAKRDIISPYYGIPLVLLLRSLNLRIILQTPANAPAGAHAGFVLVLGPVVYLFQLIAFLTIQSFTNPVSWSMSCTLTLYRTYGAKNCHPRLSDRLIHDFGLSPLV